MTPGEAIKRFCRDCVGSTQAVQQCQGDGLINGAEKNCLLFRFRLGRGRPSVKLIRQYCLYCAGGSFQEVRECADKGCPLFRFRFGRNPNYTQTFTRTKKPGLTGSFPSRIAVNG